MKVHLKDRGWVTWCGIRHPEHIVERPEEGVDCRRCLKAFEAYINRHHPSLRKEVA